MPMEGVRQGSLSQTFGVDMHFCNLQGWHLQQDVQAEVESALRDISPVNNIICS